MWSKTEPAGQLTSESRSSIPDPGSDDSLFAEQRPSGMLPLPFPALCTNWSQVVLPHVWLSCLISSEAECDMGVVTGIWNGYNEITHLGGALFPVWTIMSGSGIFATNPHYCSPGRNQGWPDSNEEEVLYMRQPTIGC